MGDESYGNTLYFFLGDKSIVPNENGDLFVRDAWGNDHYTTAAGTKGDWLLRQYGDKIVVRDSDGIAYARVAGDQDRYISSLSRINPTSSTNVAALTYTASPASEQSIIGVANLSGAAWYNQKWHEVANQHPDWTKQQVYDEMTRSIQEAEWNANWEILKNEIANSRSPEERDQKIREHRPELEKYKASGIDIGNYSSSAVEPQYSIPSTSVLFCDAPVGISFQKQIDFQAQKNEDENTLISSIRKNAEEFWGNYKKDSELQHQLQRRYSEEKRQERNLGDIADALMVTPVGPFVEGANASIKGLGILFKGASEVEKLAQFAKMNGVRELQLSFDEILEFSGRRMDLAKSLLLSTKEVITGKTIPELVEFFKLTETPAARSLSGYQARIWYKWQESFIGSKLNYSKPLEEVARDAVNMRNTLRTNAREAMADNEWSNFLMSREKNKTFEEIVEKYRKQGVLGDDLWRKIIEKSMESRDSVNSLYGL